MDIYDVLFTMFKTGFVDFLKCFNYIRLFIFRSFDTRGCGRSEAYTKIGILTPNSRHTNFG